ncbi:conserved hypothetical protein, partial [Ricinus communis]
MHVLPGQAEARQVLLETVRIVRLALGRARDGEQLASRVRQRQRLAANPHHGLQLQCLELVELRRGVRAEQGVEIHRWHPRAMDGVAEGAPELAQAPDFTFDDHVIDAAGLGQRGHAGDRGGEVAEVARPAR